MTINRIINSLCSFGNWLISKPKNALSKITALFKKVVVKSEIELCDLKGITPKKLEDMFPQVRSQRRSARILANIRHVKGKMDDEKRLKQCELLLETHPLITVKSFASQIRAHARLEHSHPKNGMLRNGFPLLPATWMKLTFPEVNVQS